MLDSDIYKAVYFWYEDKKLNVVPFDTVNRKPALPEYKKYQNKRITIMELNDWLNRGLFKKGMAVFPGKIYSENQEGFFWVSIDLDSQTAIDEFVHCLEII